MIVQVTVIESLAPLFTTANLVRASISPPSFIEAVAVAPEPAPPVNPIVGAEVYPVPPAVTVTAVTTPPETVAVAVAPVPPPLVKVTVGAEV